jgi:hypothetical protein
MRPTVELVGAMGLRMAADPASLKVVGAGPEGKLAGTTEEVYMPDNEVWGLRLGTKGNYLRQVGLVFKGRGRLDTVEFYESGDRLGRVPGHCPDSISFSACLAGYPGFGLLHPPILPAWEQARPIAPVWILEERSEHRPRRGAESRRVGSISLFYQERPNVADQPRFFEAGQGSWVLGIGGKYLAVDLVSDTARRISEFQVDHIVREVAFMQGSGKGWMLGAVESGSSYSDGNFEDIYLLAFHPERDTLHVKVVPFTGASGESGGSTVDGSWWIGIGPSGGFRLYVATAQEGNESGENRGLNIRAYEVAESGEILTVGQSGYDVVTFGAPSSRETADSLAESLRAGGQVPGKAGWRALPILAEGGMRWLAGTVAPDSSTAIAWAGLHPSGSVRRVKAAPPK